MEGKGTVRRLSPATAESSDTPAIRRMAPRNFSVIFMIVFCIRFVELDGVNKKGSRGRPRIARGYYARQTIASSPQFQPRTFRNGRHLRCSRHLYPFFLQRTECKRHFSFRSRSIPSSTTAVSEGCA